MENRHGNLVGHWKNRKKSIVKGVIIRVASLKSVDAIEHSMVPERLIACSGLSWGKCNVMEFRK